MSRDIQLRKCQIMFPLTLGAGLFLSSFNQENLGNNIKCIWATLVHWNLCNDKMNRSFMSV